MSEKFNQFKKTSIPLQGGGDTHFHMNKNLLTVTTTVKGGYKTHDHFRANNMNSAPTCPEVLKNFDKTSW